MTHRSFAVLLLPVLLAACSFDDPDGRRDPLGGPALTPQHAACREEARRSQNVEGVMQQLNMNNWGNEERISRDLRGAELQAYRDCLRRNGLAVGGGVEPVSR